jgi:hypothetical protein
MIAENLASLRIRVRLRRGNEHTLIPDMNEIERHLMDRRRILDCHRDMVRHHADRPFTRFEEAMNNTRLALSRQRWSEALDQMAAAGMALTSIERRAGLRQRLDGQQRVHREAIAEIPDDVSQLRSMSAFATSRKLLGAAEKALADGQEGLAEQVAAMHRACIDRWQGTGTPSGRRALATLMRLTTAPAAERRLPSPLGYALRSMESKGLAGLAGALALDVLVQVDGWRLHQDGLIAEATDVLDAVLAWTRDRLDHSST